MRTFLNSSGVDTTAAVLAYLNQTPRPRPHYADLYVINTAPCYAGEYLGKQFLLTDYSAPLNWAYRGTFVPGVIERGGVQSKIGLEADTLDVTWSPQLTDILATDSATPPNVLLTALQGIFAGVFDNGSVEVWRVLMPTIGDCDTFGACLLFSGRFGKPQVDRLTAKVTAVSRLELLNVQVPTIVIEPGNILTQYSCGVIPPNGPASFTILAGSTASVILANPVSAPSGYTPVNDLYNTGYIVMGSGTQMGGSYRRIRQQLYGATHVFYLQFPLPFAPKVGDTFTPFVPVPAGYSIVPLNGSPFPATQALDNGSLVTNSAGVIVAGSDWDPGNEYTWGLSDETLTLYPNDGGGSGSERIYTFLYHTLLPPNTAYPNGAYADVYLLDQNPVLDFNALWPVVCPAGYLGSSDETAVIYPGAVSGVQPAQNEPGIGAIDGNLGFPYVPVADNSPVAV